MENESNRQSSIVNHKLKQLVVLGAGESGIGTAILGKQKGYNVFVSDKGTIAKKYKKVLLNNDISFEEGKHTEAKILEAAIVMKSPGIPDTVSIVTALKQKGISVISEIEFASKYTNGVVVGITGSNGKTTTTMLLHHILKKENFNVSMGGNIGKSFAQQVAEVTSNIHVLELSSFQLDGIETFAPHIAIITNITPDHLDRYANKFENYISSKFRITENQTEKDFLIYDYDDEVITSWLKKNKVKATLVPFSIVEELEQGVYLKNKQILINYKTTHKVMGISTLALKGKHNTKNAMAAAMAASLLKVRKETIRESLEDFEGAEHRLESVLKINGVQYINDSKATNVNATFYALDSMQSPTVWIVGGVDKGNDYLDLMPLVREKVKAIICLGVDNQKIVQTFYNVVDLVVETVGAEEAVKVAYKIAEKGDTVLLSPACASFDLFENYEDRGNKFKKAVREL
ncbi:UDP-N-acetylmuramoyl-L-alanine--D-glutamate ligase [Lutibacter sp.]